MVQSGQPLGGQRGRAGGPSLSPPWAAPSPSPLQCVCLDTSLSGWGTHSQGLAGEGTGRVVGIPIFISPLVPMSHGIYLLFFLPQLFAQLPYFHVFTV